MTYLNIFYYIIKHFITIYSYNYTFINFVINKTLCFVQLRTNLKK